MNYKKKIRLMSCLIILIFILLFISVFFKTSNEATLNKNLKELGTSAYEEKYYPFIGDDDESRSEYLSKFSSNGIKFSLDTLAIMYKVNDSNVLDEYVNNKTKKKCDFEKSIVIIYPKEPYGKKDYTIKVELECGF